MSVQEQYTITIEMASSVITPFQSDTLFGHLCWAVRYLDWGKHVDRLDDFLNEYDTSGTPPLLISNGFPKNSLPMPILPPMLQSQIDTVADAQNRVKEAFLIKTIKKIPYILKSHFKILQEEGLSSVKLFNLLYRNFKDYSLFLQNTVFSVQRNNINRISNTVTEGLHFDRETFFPEDGKTFEIYVETSFFSKSDLERIFEYIGLNGYGKNKSTGKGAFTFSIDRGTDIPEPVRANGFMSLSSWIPTRKDPVNGYYNLMRKYGKLAGGYQAAFPEAGKNPFKVPLLMLSPGSIFHDSDFCPKKSYGSLLKGVHEKSEKVRHFACAYPIAVNIAKQEDGDEF